MNSQLPAFPLSREISETLPNTGLTKREYFAGLAMQAIISRNTEDSRFINNIGLPDLAFTARESVAYADALLSAL